MSQRVRVEGGHGSRGVEAGLGEAPAAGAGVAELLGNGVESATLAGAGDGREAAAEARELAGELRVAGGEDDWREGAGVWAAGLEDLGVVGMLG